MESSLRKTFGKCRFHILLFVIVSLSACQFAEEKRTEAINSIDTLSNSASGVVKNVVDAGDMVVDTVHEAATDVADRVDKIRRGSQLLKEGLTGNDQE